MARMSIGRVYVQQGAKIAVSCAAGIRGNRHYIQTDKLDFNGESRFIGLLFFSEEVYRHGR